jgi:hypothetical protein
MQEFDSVSVSSYEADALSAQLTERSADGWEVVSIVSAGSEVIAFLSRAATGDGDTATGDEPADTAQSTPDAADSGTVAAAATAAEPSGWASEPEASASESSWDTGAAAAGASGWDTSTTASPAQPSAAESSSSGSGDSGWVATGASEPAEAAAPQASAPAVPAGWFTDPSNRYELRYWDGSAWTEHVARGGQQFTDPPVA